MHWLDLRAVAALESQIYPDTAWSMATWWAELAARPLRHYLVSVQGEGGDSGPGSALVSGYAGLTLSGQVAEVMTIAVDPAYRGRGIGTVLLTALHDSARALGARQMMLEARADNEPALLMYAASGYRAVRTRRGYYQPGSVDAVIHHLDLTSEGSARGR